MSDESHDLLILVTDSGVYISCTCGQFCSPPLFPETAVTLNWVLDAWNRAHAAPKLPPLPAPFGFGIKNVSES